MESTGSPKVSCVAASARRFDVSAHYACGAAPAPADTQRRRRLPSARGDQLLERDPIEQRDDTPADVNQRLVAQTREEPAHRLELEPELAADLLAAHTEYELRRRVTAGLIPARQVQQEPRQPLLGA